jgi:OmpA family
MPSKQSPRTVAWYSRWGMCSLIPERQNLIRGLRKLDQLAQFLTEHPDRRVQVDGFTDSVGTDSYNLDLSQRRADAVRSAVLARD